MHGIVVPGKHGLTDALLWVFIYVLQEHMGIADKILVCLFEVCLVKSIAVVVTAIELTGGDSDDPQVGAVVIRLDGIPEFLYFCGGGFDEGCLYEAHTWLACLRQLTAQVDDFCQHEKSPNILVYSLKY